MQGPGNHLPGRWESGTCSLTPVPCLSPLRALSSRSVPYLTPSVPGLSPPCPVSPLACLLGLRTAVVGAGIGGSAVAHFLQQHFGPRVQIDVFEKGTVGGRLATISVNKQHYESGAASFHSLSLHMQDFVKQLGECTVLGSSVLHPGLAAATGLFPDGPEGQGQKVMWPNLLVLQMEQLRPERGRNLPEVTQ